MSYWTREKLDAARMIAGVSGPGFGGTAVFLGTVRAGPEDGPVARIEYSAYEPMLNREFDLILAEANQRWSDAKIDGMHRLGSVPVGEASIAIVAAAPHRSEAFAACRYVIEEVKQRLPVWKKEILEDGSESWRPNRVDGASEITTESATPPSS